MSAVTDRLTPENIRAIAAVLARVEQRMAAAHDAGNAPPPDSELNPGDGRVTMMMPDRPPGRETRDGPVTTPGRPHQVRTSPPPQRVSGVPSLLPGADIGRDVPALLALSDERDLWMARLLAAERAAYRLGYYDGFRDGGEELWARRRAAPPIVIAGPTFAELERRRWGPGGRERFGDPRPGDFPGFGPIPRRTAASPVRR